MNKSNTTVERRIRRSKMTFFWIGYQSFLQPLYFTTGLAQFVAAYFCMKQEKKLHAGMQDILKK